MISIANIRLDASRALVIDILYVAAPMSPYSELVRIPPSHLGAIATILSVSNYSLLANPESFSRNSGPYLPVCYLQDLRPTYRDLEGKGITC